MKTDFMMVRTMPYYLTIQATVMVATFLEFPAYFTAYRANNFVLFTPWLGVWMLLTVVGLVFGTSAIVRQELKRKLEPAQRLKLAGGYWLGTLAGLLGLGIRFMPLTSGAYFYLMGALALVLVFIFWKNRPARQEELFP
jgi:hypothetical protein